MTSLANLVHDVPNLISLPTVALRIDQVLSSESASLEDAARIIETDPALTSKLLQVANSALFGGHGDIDNLNRALARVGTRQTRQLVLGLELANSFNGLPSELITMDDFWRHSLYCATICRHIADARKLPNRDTAFTAGLLHDLGQLVLFLRCPDEARRFLWRSLDESDGRCTDQAERHEMGFDHAELGYELAKLWNFPTLLQQCIYGHHQPDRIADTPKLVYLVHLANSLAVMVELDCEDWDEAPPVIEETWAALDLRKDEISGYLENIKEETQELMKLFASEG